MYGKSSFLTFPRTTPWRPCACGPASSPTSSAPTSAWAGPRTGSTRRRRRWCTGGNCIKISLPGKSILGDYFQENRTSQRPFLVLRIRFPGRPMFIQFIPAAAASHCRRRRRTRSQCRCCSCSVGGWRNRIRTADFADFVQP